jgi:hypothetical protein
MAGAAFEPVGTAVENVAVNFTSALVWVRLHSMDIETLLETVEAEVECGQCGGKSKRTIAWLKANGMYECPVCGEATDLRTEEWTARIQDYIDACSNFDS